VEGKGYTVSWKEKGEEHHATAGTFFEKVFFWGRGGT